MIKQNNILCLFTNTREKTQIEKSIKLNHLKSMIKILNSNDLTE